MNQRKTLDHYTLFISDLHLEESRQAFTHIFLNLLKTDARAADALYILGDFFEVWVGDDEYTPFHASIIDGLKDLSNSGVPIYLMRGNRDFLLGQRFAQEAGIQILKDPTIVELYGKPTLLMHGDGLCTDDFVHQKFRQITHSKPFQKLFLKLPLKLRKRIGNYLRKISRNRVPYLSESMMDVTTHAVENVMRQHETHLLIHGHTHKSAVHLFDIDEKPSQRIVLGDWHHYGNYLKWKSDHTFETRILKISNAS